LEPDTPPPRERSRPRIAARLPRLLESVLIVLSVVLGFALTEWRQQQAERKLARTVLENVRREMAQNLATLERIPPKHARMAERLATAAVPSAGGGQTAFDVFAREMPEGGLDLSPLRDAAWETAVTTGALRLLDYEKAALVSEVYQIQRASIVPTIQRISDRFLAPQNFDPLARTAMLRTHHMLFVEISGQESYLMETYRRVLKQLAPEP
jgi:hypothetical protein